MGQAGRLASGLAIVSAGLTASGQAPSPTPACRETVVSGRVERGQAFEAALGTDLMFRLAPETHPENPPGWTIQISPAAEPQADYLMVATPPYRFSNPRYVSTAYGITVAAALSWTPREFAFVAESADFDTARDAIGVLLWPGNHSQAEVAAEPQALDRLTTYPGALRIEGGAASPPEATVAGSAISWMAFTAELCVPDDPRP